MNKIAFNDLDGTFVIDNPENYSGLYFPIAGEAGIKSCITPNLSGDAKLDQNHFLLEPVSIENLHNNKNTRNFWAKVTDKGVWSVCGSSAMQEAEKFTSAQDESSLEAGFMWQKLVRKSNKYGLLAETTSFVTIDGDVEISLVDIKNISSDAVEIEPIAAVPVYGRSADNLRDHRHVTSLLHRTEVIKQGIVVTPVLSFDERGHQRNNISYFVAGFSGEGDSPISIIPTNDVFIGEGGSFLNPEAVRVEIEGRKEGYCVDGKESVGALKFDKTVIAPNQTVSFIVILGATEDKKAIPRILARYSDREKIVELLSKLKEYWKEKVNVAFNTGNKSVDNYLKWVCFQPILRRIYGCSFLPYHDYGKGGRGWRDLWQDCLALLIMEPMGVRKMILDNYSGVRIDGTNATIIGSKQGEFIADRNNITRVWMDHGFWPFVTTKLYIDQTGDIEILLEKVKYFKDPQIMRGTDKDTKWNAKYGNEQRTAFGEVYYGSVIEHILLENLSEFYDVGEHNHMKLRGADWNDALDMASQNGESVAFTCAYAGNLKDIAECLKALSEKCTYKRIEIAEELTILLASGNNIYDNPLAKINVLNNYLNKVKHNISGNKVVVSVDDIYANLIEKSEWIMKHVRETEWISDSDGNGWFNGYYDNSKNKVERADGGEARMMLTGQVFAIMSGTAREEEIRKICSSADKHLYDKNIGGYRLNSDFKEEKYDLGRMFGFAYGEKENGAVFSHMAVMYGYSLYKQGFVAEGHKVLSTLMDTAMNFNVSKMYPGIPEYFNNEGRGMYPYLTGAASWYMLTMINQVFGVKGEYGDLIIAPALMPEQFDENGVASLELMFAERKFVISIINKKKLMCGTQIVSASCDGKSLDFLEGYGVKLNKSVINTYDIGSTHTIEVVIS